MRLPKTERLTRAEAKARGIGRKIWKKDYKKIGKMKYKRLHKKATQEKPEMIR